MKLGSALPMILFGLTLAGVVRANDQQAQQACVNGRNLFARRSIWLVNASI